MNGPLHRLILHGSGFFLSLSAALVAYFLSTFLANNVGIGNVDILFALASVATLALLPQFVRLMSSIGRGRATFYALLVHLFALLAFSFQMPPPFVAGVFIIYLASLIGGLFGLDVVLEKYSADSSTGRIRGRHLTVLNFGWLFAPYLAGRLMAMQGFHFLSGVAAVVTVPAVLAVGIWFYGAGRGIVTRQQGMGGSFALLSQRPIAFAMLVAISLQIFYAIMVIETPLVLRSLGFSPEVIGTMFTVMLLPFVFIQYPLGKLADRRFGEREILICGFVITAIATLGMVAAIRGTLPWLPAFWWWTALLFLSRIGAASIEVMRDSYFYKHVDGRDLHVIALLWSALPIAYILAPVFSTVTVRFFGTYATVFALLGVALLGVGASLLRLPDTK